eukprot:34655-Eustigmatos_ZCMA.PRE.1
MSPIFITLAMAPQKVSAILPTAVCILPLRVRVIPSYLNSVTSSRGVPMSRKVGTAEVSLLKKTTTF